MSAKNIEKFYNKQYFKLVIGFTLSTLTTPLLGSIDTAVVGQLTNPAYIGGVALGGTIFNTIYWILGFLRVSTSGYSAMAYGSKDKKEQTLTLFRPMIVSIIIGLLFLLFQDTILWSATHFYNSTPEIMENMKKYYKILIWGAPFVLTNYSILGWIMGRKKIRECIILQFLTNIINIVLDIYFVNGLNLAVEGVAYATLIAQIFTTLLSFIIIFFEKNKDELEIIKNIKNIQLKDILDIKSAKTVGRVNTDLIIRTICLMTVTNIFMEQGSLYGPIVLAANSILFQIQYLISYIFDGISNANSVFIGNGIGEKNNFKINWVIKKAKEMCFIISVFLMIIILFFGDGLISLFSNNQEVILTAIKFKIWLLIFIPSISVGLVFYGIFTGGANTRFVRNSMLQSLVLFAVVYIIGIPNLQNHGLWLSFVLFSLGRSLFLYRYLERMKKLIF